MRIRALHACFVYVCTIYGWMDERLHRLSSSSAAGARAHFWMWKQKSRALTAPCRLSPRTSNDIASQGESGQASQKASKPPTRIWQPSTRPSWTPPWPTTPSCAKSPEVSAQTICSIRGNCNINCFCSFIFKITFS